MPIGQILPILAALGIPGAVTGIIVWRLERRMESRDRARQAQEAEAEKARRELELLNIRATLAALGLAKATASAVERIPDAHCNGEMHGALEHARAIEQQVQAFLAAQGVRAVVG